MRLGAEWKRRGVRVLGSRLGAASETGKGRGIINGIVGGYNNVVDEVGVVDVNCVFGMAIIVHLFAARHSSVLTVRLIRVLEAGTEF